jgi:hypothetical protein
VELSGLAYGSDSSTLVRSSGELPEPDDATVYCTERMGPDPGLIVSVPRLNRRMVTFTADGVLVSWEKDVEKPLVRLVSDAPVASRPMVESYVNSIWAEAMASSLAQSIPNAPLVPGSA